MFVATVPSRPPDHIQLRLGICQSVQHGMCIINMKVINVEITRY
jgi:hypothetical protein